MDTVTQMALGAVIGQAIGYRKLGAKAAIYGALGGLIPDLDVLYTDYFGPYGSWQYHRHITHSVFFAPLVAPLLGWLTWAIHKRVPGHYKYYVWIWLLAILTHPLLDTLTVYGTQLLAPFSDTRFVLSAVSIIDPIYTLPLFAALFLPAIPWFRHRAQGLAITILILTTAFLGYCWHLNNKAESLVMAQLTEQNINPSEVSVYTTIFQPYLRRAVIRENINGTEWLRVGFVSTFDPQPIKWACQKQENGTIRDMVLATEAGRIFNWFSGDELSYAREGNQVIVMDARYGIPGQSTFGFWGLSFELDGDVIAASDEPAYVRAPREATREAIAQLFRAAYGLPNDFLPKEDINCP